MMIKLTDIILSSSRDLEQRAAREPEECFYDDLSRYILRIKVDHVSRFIEIPGRFFGC